MSLPRLFLQTRSPEYIAKFFTNLAPAIEHGTNYFAESAAAMRYIATVYPSAAKYYSKKSAARAKMDMLLDFINTGICKYISVAVYPTLQFPPYAGEVASLDFCTPTHTAAAMKAATEAIVDMLQDKYVEILLKRTKFLLSDTPTIADFRFAPLLSQVKVATELPPRLEQYLDDMYALPGFAQAMQPVDDYNEAFWK
jgi:glutathione S-transferase